MNKLPQVTFTRARREVVRALARQTGPGVGGLASFRVPLVPVPTAAWRAAFEAACSPLLVMTFDDEGVVFLARSSEVQTYDLEVTRCVARANAAVTPSPG